MRCGAVRCGAVRCGAVRCNAVWGGCGAVRAYPGAEAAFPSFSGLSMQTVSWDRWGSRGPYGPFYGANDVMMVLQHTSALWCVRVV
jgi:hypothetical protein